MFYRQRELRRLWRVEVYDGDPEGDGVTTHIETVIAFNAVAANRKAGGPIAKEPVALHYVTWPEEENGPVFRVNSTKEGPVGDPIEPTIACSEP